MSGKLSSVSGSAPLPGRISLLITSFANTGIESTMIRLANGLCAAGCDVDMVAMSGSGTNFRHMMDSRVRVVDLGCRRLWNSLPSLLRYVRRERPVAMISGASLANGFAGLAKWLSGVPMVSILTEHGIYLFGFADRASLKRKLLKRVLELGYRQADALVGVSQGVAEQLRGLPYVDHGRVDVIYNPVWSVELEQAAERPLDHPWLSPTSSVPVVVAVGRLSREKAYSTLLSAFALVRQKRDARLIILGEGEKRHELEGLVDKLSLCDVVDMPGFVEDPQRYVKRADLFVMSSMHEALPTAMIEALSVGTAIVSTDCPTGPREILAGGRYGTLVPPDDPFALANGILSALSVKVDSNRQKERAKDFSVEVAVQRYLDLITEIRASGAPPDQQRSRR